MTTETVDLAPLNARMEEHTLELREVRNQIANIIGGRSRSRPAHDPASAFAAILKMVADDPGQNRALADVIGTSPGQRRRVDPGRVEHGADRPAQHSPPPVQCSGHGPVPPSSGYGIAFPKITTHTQVAKRTAEKAEAATREAIISAVTFAMEWFAGAVDVSLELISQSDPSVGGSDRLRPASTSTRS